MTPAWIAYPEWFFSALLYGAVGLQVLFVLGHALRPKYRRLFGWRAPLKALRNSLPAFPIQLYLWIGLIAILAPWWWASVLVVHLAERFTAIESYVELTPTALFLASVALFYFGYGLRRALGLESNRKFRSFRSLDEQPPVTKKRVAVIGAGMAGLVAAKELKEEGHEVVVFEKTQGWGGVWAASKKRGGTSWATTMTSTGALNSTFSDSPTPIYHPENGLTPLHYTRQQFHDMLVAYEQRYRVFDDCLRCHSELVELEALPGERWRLGIEDTRTGESSLEEFDAVTFCTGLNHESWRPELPGQGNFRGPELHVEDHDPSAVEQYANKTVLILGTGETASDLAKELIDNGAEHVYISQRSPTMMLPRNSLSQPPDYVESRLTYAGPMLHRWCMLFGAGLSMWWPLIQPMRNTPPGPGPWFKLLLGMYNPIKVFPALMGSINTTKSDYLWMLVDAGRASLVPKVLRVTAQGVTLDNDQQLDVDAIIYCTGFRTQNPFLPAPTRLDGTKVESPTARDMYKQVIHPDHPTLAMIGFTRGLIGAITVSTELQSRWWALLVSGKRQLPEPGEMRRHIDYLNRKSAKFAQSTRTTMTYANSLARHDIGCEPDMFKLFFNDRELWWIMLNGVICNSHYRIHGVHAKPDLAREQLTMECSLHDPDYVDSIDVAYNALPLAFLLIPLWTIPQRLFPVFQLESALSSYV